MPDDVFFLSAADRTILQALIADAKMRRGSLLRRSPSSTDDPDPTTTEVYIAQSPASGIPAAVTDTQGNTEPGTAECAVWRLNDDQSSPDMELSPAKTRIVYNLSGAAIAGNQWVLLIRDKYGYWYALPPASPGPAFNVVTNVCPIFADDGQPDLSQPVGGGQVFAGPIPGGAPAAPAFRALVMSDLPGGAIYSFYLDNR